MSLPRTSREIRLAARPVGPPTPADFTLAEVDLPELEDGQVLVGNLVISVDPYMRGRMDDRPSYVPPFRIGRAMDGAAIGEVLASRSPDLAEGDTVVHGLGWREYAVLPAAQARRIPPGAVSPSAWLGVLGVPGLTAYVGLTEMARLRAGDVVFVSGAAGAVGSAAVQL
nr:NADP-dependent oxidoreductase [Geodermatophilaceae bacterium]